MSVVVKSSVLIIVIREFSINFLSFAIVSFDIFGSLPIEKFKKFSLVSLDKFLPSKRNKYHFPTNIYVS